MRVAGKIITQQQLIVWIAAAFGIAICVVTLAAKHFLSIGVALTLGIVLFGLVGFLSVSIRPAGESSLSAHRRLIAIYVAFGLLALGKALFTGWTKDDTIGLTILMVLLTLFVVAYRQRRTKNP